MCHLMKRYTLVTIIRLDTEASGMYRIPASGGMHLGNSHTSIDSLLPLFIPPSLALSFPSNKIPPEAYLISLHRPSDMRSHF